jgi:hypothetical protein
VTSTETIRIDAARRGQRRVPGPARRVRLPWLAAAGAAALLAAVLMLWGFGQVSERREVVMVTGAVAEGEEITADVLGSTRVAVDSSSTQLFGVDQIDDLVGTAAATDLEVGDLLGPSSIEATAPIPDGWVEVGASLRSSRYPSTMATGDQMFAIRLDPTVDATPPVADDPTVVEVGEGVVVEVIGFERNEDRSVLAVLAVPADDAARVARWAASEDLVLVRAAR